MSGVCGRTRAIGATNVDAADPPRTTGFESVMTRQCYTTGRW